MYCTTSKNQWLKKRLRIQWAKILFSIEYLQCMAKIKKKKITDNLFPGWPDVTEMYILPLAQSPSMLTPKPARNARHLLMLSTCKK